MWLASSSTNQYHNGQQVSDHGQEICLVSFIMNKHTILRKLLCVTNESELVGCSTSLPTME
jgi:hypothetical protein